MEVVEMGVRKFEEIVEELYEKYKNAVKKEEKINKVRELAEKLGFDVNNVKIEYEASTCIASAEIDVSDFSEQLREIAEYIVGEKYEVKEILALIMSEELEELSKCSDTDYAAKTIRIRYKGYRDEGFGDYSDYFELCENVYLVVRSHKVS